MDRIIAQDPMIIPASGRGVTHTATTARRSPAKSCTSPRMSGIRRKRPDRRRSMSPAPRPSAIAASDCMSRHSPGSRRVSRPRSRPLDGWRPMPVNKRDQTPRGDQHLLACGRLPEDLPVEGFALHVEPAVVEDRGLGLYRQHARRTRAAAPGYSGQSRAVHKASCRCRDISRVAGCQSQHHFGQGLWRYASGRLERYARGPGEKSPDRNHRSGPGRLTARCAGQGARGDVRRLSCSLPHGKKPGKNFFGRDLRRKIQCYHRREHGARQKSRAWQGKPNRTGCVWDAISIAMIIIYN